MVLSLCLTFAIPEATAPEVLSTVAEETATALIKIATAKMKNSNTSDNSTGKIKMYSNSAGVLTEIENGTD